MSCASRGEVVANLPPVDLSDLSRVVDDGDGEGAAQVFVATGSVEADALELTAERSASSDPGDREPVAERAVGVAELEVFEELGVLEPSFLEVCEGLGALLERVVIVVDDARDDDGVRLVGLGQDVELRPRAGDAAGSS